MEEFFNVIIGMAAVAALVFFVNKIHTKKTGKPLTIIIMASFTIGMIIHSSAVHTMGERLKDIFHFFDKEKDL